MQAMQDIKLFIQLIIIIPVGLFVVTMLILKILYIVEVISYEHTKSSKEKYLLDKLQK